MLLTVDIGNSCISAGVFDAGDMKAVFSLSTVLGRTSDEYGILLKEALSSAGIGPGMVKAVIACSVVPSLVPVMRRAINRYIGPEPVFVSEDVAPRIKALVDAPLEVGADRLVNALAAYRRFNCALIVVDIGTAATFDLVSVDGSFMGGAIAPGPGLAAKALFEKTAKLPMVDVVKTSGVIGKKYLKRHVLRHLLGFCRNGGRHDRTNGRGGSPNRPKTDDGSHRRLCRTVRAGLQAY